MCRSLLMVRTTTSPELSPTRICSVMPCVRRTSRHSGAGGLHGQGGIAGAQGMVFMRQGGTEQGHNAVAHDLIHRAFVAVHGSHHQMQSGIEELVGVFRIEVGR